MTNGDGESKITIKLWCVIALFIGIFGFFFITAMAHESRLTRVETTLEVKVSGMTEAIKALSAQMERHIERNR
jgi:hypothetical protein